VARARSWALNQLRPLYAGFDEVSTDIQLVVSELVTNAVQAEASHLLLALDAHHTYLRISVSDDAPGLPVQRRPTAEDRRGRGLMIVDAVSSAWGARHENGTKTVWAHLPLNEMAGPSFDCAA
jgi:anti-sigma regulatory factor (Ser/Thr protein kinase)